ncbi:MAG: NADH:ubiquinone reductase (Na(+)-transporting) subunit C [Verrucomicrobia bacterium]|nr:NADH:ubiquinone reductase (Na(+)-transporting) subunit C [Verrucomicrobiota bacterium]
MIKEDLKTIKFAAIICVVCSLILSTTVALLKERQDDNVELDRMINVLKAFGQPITNGDGRSLNKEEVDAIFAESIEEIIIDKESGDILEGMTSVDLPKKERKAKTSKDRTMLPLYQWIEDGKITQYAFPISGMGLWSILHGYLSVDSSLTKFQGITFYKHGETPGMGAEIVKPWFQDQFKEKVFFKDGELKRFEVKKEGASPDDLHAVSGISAATMTGNGINVFLNRDLALYEKYFSKIRGKEIPGDG